MIKKLFPYLNGYKARAFAAMLAMTLEVIFEVFIPFIMKDIINVGLETGNIPYIIGRGAMMVGASVLSLFCGVSCSKLSSDASAGLAANVRTALFAKVQSFSFANVDKFSTASLITRLTSDVNNVQMTFMMSIRLLVRAPIMLVMSIIMALTVNLELSLVFVFSIPSLMLFLLFMMKKAFPRFQAMLKKFDLMNANLQENTIAIRVVKAFVREPFEIKNFNDTAELVRAAQIKAEKLMIFMMPVAMFIMSFTMLGTLYYGGTLIIGEKMLTGDLLTFVNYITMILMSLMMLSMMFVNLVLTKASTTRIVEVLDEELDVRDNEENPDLKVADGSIEFDDVSFSYTKNKDNLTLEKINLKIASGETVGIIGGTGSAKTTLAQLIPRLYDVLSGSIKVGGKDVRDYALHNLRNEVSMVLQNNVLFSGTIKSNLRWGDAEATDEQIINACKAAQAHKFITEFPDGYETELGQGGVNVSGGQKQRLCIARALLKRPKIIIMDDSTSAVDTHTDSELRAALKRELSDTTTIIIAQRITSVMDADKIIVMHDGKINAVGTHDELIKSNEIYRDVYNSQQKGVA